MKKLLILLFVPLAFTACKKDSDPTPQSPADAVTGRYALASFRYNDGTDELDLPKLPATANGITASGTVELTKATGENLVNMRLTLKVTGEKDGTVDIEDIEVRASGKVYGLFIDGTRVADADGDNLIFNVSEGGQTLAFTATK